MFRHANKVKKERERERKGDTRDGKPPWRNSLKRNKKKKIEKIKIKENRTHRKPRSASLARNNSASKPVRE